MVKPGQRIITKVIAWATPQARSGWRERVLNGFLYGFFAIGTLAVATVSINAIEQNRLDLLLPIYLVAYAVVVLLALRPQLGFTLRTSMLLLMLFSLGLVNLLESGLSGNGRVFFFAIVILTAILFNLRYTIGALLLIVLTMAVVAWLLLTGHLQIPISVQANSTDLNSWFNGTAVFIVLSIATALSITYLIRGLEANEKRYHTLFDNSQNAIFIASPRGRIVDINPAGLDLFGYTKQEAIKIKVLDLFAQSDGHQRFWQELKQQGLVQDFEARLRQQDGIVRNCLMTATARRANNGKILSYQAIITDITERQLAEQLLKDYSHILKQKVEERTAQLEAQVEQLTTLNFITQMVGSSHDLQGTLEIVAREMVKLFKARHGDIAPPQRSPNRANRCG